MAMTTCRECSANVSDEARTCPHCGATLRKARRGCLGTGAILLFWGWQALMVVWLVSYWGDVAPMVDNSADEASRAGAAIGATIGTGLVLGMWAIGSVIFGLVALLTRPR